MRKVMAAHNDAPPNGYQADDAPDFYQGLAKIRKSDAMFSFIESSMIESFYLYINDIAKFMEMSLARFIRFGLPI
ncbi:MAG TPA: hypothetical protein VM657_02015 [Sphingomonas sp.]|nr:hypothetical protein [Sphingomonas sp.]